MYNAVVEFLQELVDSLAATGLPPALAAKLATLITLVGNLESLASAQEQPVDGQLEDREQALNEAQDAAIVVAGAVLSYARTTRQNDLAAKVRHLRTEFQRTRRAERMRIAQRVHAAAAPIVTQLADYGLTPAALDDLRAKITATEQAVNAPVSTKAVKKVSTRELNRVFAQVDDVLAEIDPMLLKLQSTDPKMHSLYLAARTVFDRPGARQVGDEQPAAASTPVATQSPAETKATA
jgi:hypothetical protein